MDGWRNDVPPLSDSNVIPGSGSSNLSGKPTVLKNIDTRRVCSTEPSLLSRGAIESNKRSPLWHPFDGVIHCGKNSATPLRAGSGELRDSGSAKAGEQKAHTCAPPHHRRASASSISCSTGFSLQSGDTPAPARHSFIRGVYSAISGNVLAFGDRTRINHGVEH
jgi:hypothetical protein